MEVNSFLNRVIINTLIKFSGEVVNLMWRVKANISCKKIHLAKIRIFEGKTRRFEYSIKNFYGKHFFILLYHDSGFN